MSSSERLRPWVLAITVVVGLAGCASGEAKVTAGRDRLEPALDPQTKRPILLPVPMPDLNRDARQVIKEMGGRQGRDALRESPSERPIGPGLGYDTTQGIQSQSLEKALNR
jgi:hypothetical protein